MVYSPRLKDAIGAVRSTLADIGLGRQSSAFARHGTHAPAPDAPLVLVACSGGRDSLALAAVSATVCGQTGLRCGAVVIDHGIAVDSRSVAARAASQCVRLGLDPVRVRAVHVRRSDRGMEAQARQARYAGLADEARRLGAAVVLLAHTRDDQAETVLIGLLRSGGLEAVAGMPVRVVVNSVRFARPLLTISRAQTTGICTDLGLSWWDDPSNGDAYPPGERLPRSFPLRSRVRHDLLAYLGEFAGGDVRAKLADGARLARRDLELLDGMASSALARAEIPVGGRERRRGILAMLDGDALVRCHQSIRMRAIVMALGRQGITAHHTQVEAVDGLVADWHGQGPVSMSCGYSANRQGHVILLCEDGSHADRRHSG